MRAEGNNVAHAYCILARNMLSVNVKRMLSENWLSNEKQV